VFFPCEETFRKSAQKLNRVLWRKEEQEVRARTMANLVEREGELLQAQIWKNPLHLPWAEAHQTCCLNGFQGAISQVAIF
jgi:hypothetical protein